MLILELKQKVREAAEKRTHTERIELLLKANIIDNDGYYSAKFFSRKTVAKDKKSRAAVSD